MDDDREFMEEEFGEPAGGASGGSYDTDVPLPRDGGDPAAQEGSYDTYLTLPDPAAQEGSYNTYLTLAEPGAEAGAMTQVAPGDDALYSMMRPKLAPEEYNRQAAGLMYGQTTHYMGAEEREAYQVQVNEAGQLVDAEGNPYTSSLNTHNQYPGSTGGDIFVMDQGGLFAADADALQTQLNSGAPVGPGRGSVVHHSTLAAGQREEDDEGGVVRPEMPLRVAAAGELRAQDGELRSISDASGHFMPSEDQTLQFVESLQDAGVNLDNTKINMVAKPVRDLEGGLRGIAPAIDTYSGEFLASEGDQIALTNKRAVMDQISGRETGPHRESDSVLYTLDERRAALDAEAEDRAARFAPASAEVPVQETAVSSEEPAASAEQVSSMYQTGPVSGEQVSSVYQTGPVSGERIYAQQGAPDDDPLRNLSAGAYVEYRDDAPATDTGGLASPLRDPSLGAPASGYDELRDDAEAAPFDNPSAYAPSTPDAGPQDLGTPDGAPPADDTASGTQWQGASAQTGRSGVTMGRQRGQEWQEATPQSGDPSGPQIGSRRGSQ